MKKTVPSPSNKNAEFVVDGPRLKIRVKKVSPLHTYYMRKMIDTDQFCAGTKLYEYYYHFMIKNLGITKSTLANPMPIGKSSRANFDRMGNAIHAEKLYKLAIDSIVNNYDRVLVKRVCIDEIPVSSFTKNRYKRSEYMQRLRMALDDIAYTFSIK